MIKKVLCMGVLCVGSLWAGAVCDQKKVRLSQKMEFAKQTNNVYMMQDLQRAMSAIEHFCDDANVIVDTKKKIASIESKILESQDDIAIYQAKGKFSKIEEKQFEINELKAELQANKEELEFYESL